jgi:hypothetical protein
LNGFSPLFSLSHARCRKGRGQIKEMADEGSYWINVRPCLKSLVDPLALRYAALYLRGEDPEDEGALLREAAAARAAGKTIGEVRAGFLDALPLLSGAEQRAGAEERERETPSAVSPPSPRHGPATAPDTPLLPEGRLAVKGGAVFPLLVTLLQSLGRPVLSPAPIGTLRRDDMAAYRLKALFDLRGSERAREQESHWLYAAILRSPEAVKAILGMGFGLGAAETASPSDPSSARVSPARATLRAFRDYCPNASLFGMVSDRRLLFEEERIRTLFAASLAPSAFEPLAAAVPDGFDLIIDEGREGEETSLAALSFALHKLKPGGFAVIENISPAALPFWQVVSALLPSRLRLSLLEARRGFLFVVQR